MEQIKTPLFFKFLIFVVIIISVFIFEDLNVFSSFEVKSVDFNNEPSQEIVKYPESNIDVSDRPLSVSIPNGFYFNGITSFKEASLTEEKLRLNKNFSISFSFNQHEFSKTQSMLLSNRDVDGDRGIGLFMSTSSSLTDESKAHWPKDLGDKASFRIGFGGGCDSVLFETSPNVIELNKNYQILVTFTYDNTNKAYMPKLYVDGLRQGGIIYTHSCQAKSRLIMFLPEYFLDSSLNFVFGYEPMIKSHNEPSYHFKGTISNVRFYNRII